MKKKLISVLLSAAMATTMLAGCGSNNSSSSNGGAAKSGSTSSASGELDTSEFVELSMYVISDRPAGQDAIDENLNKYSNLLFENQLDRLGGVRKQISAAVLFGRRV